jgi:hypothetical protein
MTDTNELKYQIKVKQINMFGMGKQDVLDDYDKIKSRYEGAEVTYLMGILSDAQEEIELGNNVQANQFINKVKLIISTGR